MKNYLLLPAALITASLLYSLTISGTQAHPAHAAPAQAAPALPDLPGITTPDTRPRACVECHKNYPGKFDGRLSVHLKEWATKGVDAHLLAKAQSTMPAGIKLQGKHPDVSNIVKVIPTDCLMCHGGHAANVPPFRKLIHAIHLTGGKDNHYLSNYGGQCLNCHKLDQKTGTWGLGSGTE